MPLHSAFLHAFASLTSAFFCGEFAGPNGSPKKQESGKSIGLMLSRTDTSLSVQLMDWVLQFSHLLLLTRGLSVRSYPATVSVLLTRGRYLLVNHPNSCRACVSYNVNSTTCE
jgi:hypothetical protein